MADWYLHRGGQQEGPIGDANFQEALQSNALAPEDWVWQPGWDAWKPAHEFLTPPPIGRETDSELEHDGRRLEDGLSATQQVNATKPCRRWPAILIFCSLGGFFAFVLVAEPQAIPYRLAGALNGALFGATGGLLGGGLAYLIQRRFSKAAASIGAVLGFITSEAINQGAMFVSDTVYTSAIRPQADRALLERRLLSEPVFATLKEYQPGTFDHYMKAVVTGVRSGEPIDATIGRVRKVIIEPILAANAPYLSDARLVAYLKLMAAEFELFAEAKPVLCVYSLRGQSLGDVRPYLTPELARQELQLLQDAIKVDKRRLPPSYPAAERDRLLEGVVAKVAEKHGDDVLLLDPTTNVVGRERRVCEIGASYFHEIIVLPQATAGSLFRSLLAN